MRRPMLGLAALALAATGVATRPAAAVDVTGCTATRLNEGGSSCFYIALTTRGALTLRTVSGDTAATVDCPSGGHAFRETDGTSYYGQVPGERCSVRAWVLSPTGEAFAHGGSVIL